ncbi:hypothetical protein [Quatrionicoccus australiensis]|uniref:hypothetical protein n=1 Tax=Quatrionicoccus australiensis TaxID=138118 RepID=UPI001CFA4E3D|nr:hypothetical protein [Quatrionicoccus australiensis]MCB4358177.1 hypothetical protein [Quatrionicoccus australiensis]
MTTIHFFNSKRLARELASGEVSSRQRSYYLLAASLSSAAFGYSGLVSANPLWSWLSLYEAVVVAFITVVGLSRAYDAAGGDASSDFIAQFMCLSLPINITTTLPVWGCFWLITIVFRQTLIALAESHSELAINLSHIGGSFFGLLAFLAVAITEAIFFYRIVRLLGAVRGESHGG